MGDWGLDEAMAVGLEGMVVVAVRRLWCGVWLG